MQNYLTNVQNLSDVRCRI